MNGIKRVAVLLAGAVCCVSAATAQAPVEKPPMESPVISLEVKVEYSVNPQQQYRIEIYRDLTVSFYGVANTRVLGKEQGKISQRQFNNISAGFHDIRFFQLEPVYPPATISETKREISLTFRDSHKVHTVRLLDRPKYPPGFRLLLALIQRESGARQWACPLIENGEDICSFPE